MFSRLGSLFLILTLTLSAPGAQPVEVIPAEFRGAIQPQVALSPNGSVHLVFGKAGAIYYTGAKEAGAPFLPPVRIAEVPKLALGMRRGPRIVADDKRITVTAISHEEGSLQSWSSSDHGVSWKVTSLNDAANSAREGLHAMAANGTGLVAVAWLDLRNGGMEVWSTVSHDGGATWGTNQRIYKSPDGHVCECCHPSLAVDSHGRIAVMFRNWLAGSRDMYLVTSSDGGRSFGPAQKLGSGSWKLNACPMDGGALAFTPSGNIVTAWRREKKTFVTSDNPAFEEALADSATQPVVLPSDHGVIQIWQQEGGIMLKKEGAAAVRLANDAMFPAAASVPGHAPILVWESNLSGIKTILATLLE